MRLALAALTALAVTAVLAAPAGASAGPAPPVTRAAAAGSIGLRLVDVPDSAGDDPRARIYIVDHLAPGAVIHRRIVVSNTTASAARFALYPAAAGIEGGSFVGADGHTPNDLSTWTSVDPAEPTVPAGGSVTATVKIAVPGDAAPGERLGAVWAEARSAADAGGVVQVSRVGIRLYLSVGPGGPPAADFTIGSLTAQRSADGRPTVLATVHNTGGRALDMSGELQLSGGPGGLNAGPFPVSLGTTLAVGREEPVTIVLDRAIPDGPWDVEVVLRSGLVEHRARATITFPATGASVAVAPRSTRGALPYPAIAALAATALAAGTALLISRRRVRPAWKP